MGAVGQLVGDGCEMFCDLERFESDSTLFVYCTHVNHLNAQL